VNPHPIAQSEATDNLRRNKNVLRGLNKIALRIPQESKSFARNLDDAVAELWFTFQLAILRRAALAQIALGAARLIVPMLGALAAFPAFDIRTVWRTGFFDSVRRPVQVAPLSFRATPTRAIVPARKSPARTPWTVRRGASFRWSLVISFFAHKFRDDFNATEAARCSINGSSFYAGSLASNSSGISRFE
jgi:hypothetical protein